MNGHNRMRCICQGPGQRTARGSGSAMQLMVTTTGAWLHCRTVFSSSRSVSVLPVPGTPLMYMLPGQPACRRSSQKAVTRLRSWSRHKVTLPGAEHPDVDSTS